ncbi:hypothetical protein CCACVL1_30603 [Corchorus capsularis]|uniref:Uncharacterized protein n=1 Tax=Corchorus capsularis TaxID=210143 RepID=A0A1R3FWB3_COCAP|nr:hypothetical protein CCACVL1_30603 [Corchorus capsularis]
MGSKHQEVEAKTMSGGGESNGLT